MGPLAFVWCARCPTRAARGARRSFSKKHGKRFSTPSSALSTSFESVVKEASWLLHTHSSSCSRWCLLPPPPRRPRRRRQQRRRQQTWPWNASIGTIQPCSRSYAQSVGVSLRSGSLSLTNLNKDQPDRPRHLKLLRGEAAAVARRARPSPTRTTSCPTRVPQRAWGSPWSGPSPLLTKRFNWKSRRRPNSLDSLCSLRQIISRVASTLRTKVATTERWSTTSGNPAECSRNREATEAMSASRRWPSLRTLNWTEVRSETNGYYCTII